MPFDVPEMQKTQSEAPCLMCIRQTNQQIANPLILGLQFWAIAITGLAKAKGSASQRNADAPSPDRVLGHLPALRWSFYFFPKASFRSSFCMLSSANIFFRRLFSSSKPSFARSATRPCRHTSSATYRKTHCSCRAADNARPQECRPQPASKLQGSAPR